MLWVVLAVPGVWWVDLRVDGVKRGKLAEKKDLLPQSGTIIASSFTSPLDPLYLAGIFTPIFTRLFAGWSLGLLVRFQTAAMPSSVLYFLEMVHDEAAVANLPH